MDLSNLTPDEIERGKGMAILSHVSMFVGLPLWVIPMVQRDNVFALQHAKWAGATFIGAMATGAVAVFLGLATCGVLMPLAFLVFAFYVPMIQGLIAAANGRLDEPFGVGIVAETLFGSLDVQQIPKP